MEIKKNEPDARTVYADIINLPHWQSPTRPHMSLYDRAAQFAPFAALTGYDDMVNEEARIVDNKIELDDEAIENLNMKLGLISDAIDNGEKPSVSIICFVPDPLKAGGRYETVTERIRKIDAIDQKIILEKKTGVADMYATIDIKDVLEIHGELVDYIDDTLE